MDGNTSKRRSFSIRDAGTASSTNFCHTANLETTEKPKGLIQWHCGLEWNQAVSFRLFSLSKRGGSGIDTNLGAAEALTSVLATGFDDFGPTFACVLHSLGHSLSGHLVGVVGGAHCDFVLYRRQQSQMRGP